MKRLIAVLAIAFAMTFAAACTPDDGTGASGDPGLGSPSLESLPALESMPAESPLAS
jgi:hypothetical protein